VYLLTCPQDNPQFTPGNFYTATGNRVILSEFIYKYLKISLF
jgi:hypothetical protein